MVCIAPRIFDKTVSIGMCYNAFKMLYRHPRASPPTTPTAGDESHERTNDSKHTRDSDGYTGCKNLAACDQHL